MSNSQKTDRTPEFRPKPKRRRRIFSIKNFIILLIVVAVGFAFFQLATKYQESQREVERLSNPEEAAKQETQNLKTRVGELVEVPQGQEPTIATVQDVTKLQGQAFFKNAQNGDKVLIYAEAKKAILYRPSTDKIIEVAPVNLGDSQSSDQSGASTTGTTPSQ